MDLGYHVAFISVKKSNYLFYVPLCIDCSNKLNQYDKINKLGKVVSMIPLIYFSVYVFTLTHSLVFSAFPFLIGYIFLSAVFFNRGENGYGLGGYTGRYFWFSNRQFFKQFAELNPNLVAPQYVRSFSAPPSAVGDTQSGFIWSRSNIILLFVLLVCILCLVFYGWAVITLN